jgi:tripartite-type tricarboxylate transporter receptor subunit TctC
VLAGAVLGAAPLWAWAQSGASRAVRIIIPYVAGSPADIRGRIIMQALAAQLGQPVVVDNRPGLIGQELLAKATPDGLTGGLISATVAATATLLASNLNFDPERDYAPVALLANSPQAIVIDAKLNLNTMAEFIAHAKANPGKLNYGSAGVTSLVRLASELFKIEAGIDLTHIPYKGAGPAITDMLGGRVQMVIADMSGIQAHVKSGALKALAATSAKRLPLLPNVPTTAEVGLPKVISDNLTGLLVPAATPAAAKQRLHDAVVAVLKTPALVRQLEQQGIITTPDSGPAYAKLVREERARWTPIIKAHGIRADG